MNEIKKVELREGPDPWVASISIEWDTVEIGWSRHRRRRSVRKILEGITEENYQTRYDNIIDRTIVYFRNKPDAVSAYFYLS